MLSSIASSSRRLAVAAMLAAALGVSAAAHGPIWMGHYETPGKGALDMHTGIHNGEMWDLAVGLGLSRSIGIELELPVSIKKELAPAKELGFGLAWRMANWDSSKGKLAVVSTIHANVRAEKDEMTGETFNSHDFTFGLGYLAERPFWTGILAARLQPKGGHHAQEDSHAGGEMSSGPWPREAWISAAYGVRVMQVHSTQKDMMVMFETERQLQGRQLHWFAPQLLFQPNGTMLLKGGYRFPISYSRVSGAQKPRGEWAYEMEIRF